MKPRSLSLSQITRYSACAKQWHLEKVVRAPFVRGLGMIFGSAVHAGLETFNTHYFLLGPDKVDFPAIVQEFKDEFLSELTDVALKEEYEKILGQKNGRKAVKKLTLEEFKVFQVDELLQIGEALLAQYVARTDHGDKHLIIEEKYEEQLAGLTFRYIIDLLDLKDGKVRLRDYKTRAKASKKMAEMQLVGYAWLLKKYMELDVEIIEQLNFVKTPSNPRIELLEYDITRLPSDMRVFEQEIDTFIRGVEAGIFPRNREHYCDSCGVREVCFNPDKEQEYIEAYETKEDNKQVELFSV